MTGADVTAAVVFRVASVRCALPVGHVVESMRMLPVTAIDDMPPFVLGVAIIRGAGVPVVDVARLLGTEGMPARLVTVRAGDRIAALAVDEVIGVERFDRATFESRPPLLTGDGDGVVQAIARRDREVHLVLDAARLVREADPEA
jgi:purine-binding chemotaxis protein CheW